MPRWPTPDVSGNGNEQVTSVRAARLARPVMVVGILLILVLGSTLVLLVGVPTAAGVPAAPHGVLHPALPRPRAQHTVPTAPTPVVTYPATFQNVSSNSPDWDDQFNDSSCVTGNSIFFFNEQCNPWALQPSLLNLGANDTGLVYEVGSSITTPNVCGNWTATNGSSRLVFTNSTNGGTYWNQGTLIPQTNATCPYFDQLEPSFTTNATGGIVGVYVGANVTANNASTNSQYYFSPGLYSNFTNRTNDSLIFVSSSNDGANFTNGTILTGAGNNIADPEITTFGNTIYVVYENISNVTNWSSPNILPGSPALSATPNYPISVWMIVSTTGGASWGAPIPLPGENASQFNNSMSPAVAVSSTGEVAVAYLTNRSCLAYCWALTGIYPYLVNWGDDLVVVTSTNNGSNWSPINTIFSGTGEASAFGYNQINAYDDLLTNLFEYAPVPVLAWNTSGSQLYVAWTGSYNISSYDTVLYAMYGENYNYEYPAIYEGASLNAGGTWTTTRLTTLGTYNTTVYPDYSFPTYDLAPGIAVDNGTVYVTYYMQNTTYTFYSSSSGAACGYTGPSAGAGQDEAGIEELAVSSNGVAWNTTELDYAGFQENPEADLGTVSSILIENNSPMAAFSFPVPGYYCPLYCGNLQDIAIATPYVGPTTNVTFNLSFTLAAGQTQWIGVGGVPYELGNAGLTVTGVPVGFAIGVNVSAPPSPGPGFIAEGAGGGTYYFFSPTNVTISSQEYTYLNLSMSPFVGYFDWQTYNITEYLDEYYDSDIYFDTYPTPHWQYSAYGLCSNERGAAEIIPVGVPWSIGIYNYSADTEIYDGFGNAVFPSAIDGSGPGNYSGAGLDTFFINATGPVNEILYFYPVGSYDVDVAAPTLPAGTPYQFNWDGAPESAPSGGGLTLLNVTSGLHSITNISATSSQSGWTYIGWSDEGNPVYVPASPFVNLSFAYIDVGAAEGTVTFEAPQLTDGTVWQLDFNGTIYSSTTNSIQVVTHPGTYPLEAFPVTSENGSASYLPAPGVGPTITVSSGDTYDVNFTAAYQVTAIASQGGSVSPAGPHVVAPGAKLSFNATPISGWSWVGWTGTGAGSYTGPDATAQVMANGPILETANFIPLPANRYALEVEATGLPAGTSWSITVGGVGYSSTGSAISVPSLYSCSGPDSTQYALSIPDAYSAGTNQSRYVPASYNDKVCAGGRPIVVAFSAQYYLTLTATAGGSSAAAVGGGGFGGSAWVDSAATVSLRATNNPGFSFSGWFGSGPGNYTGALALPSFPMTGPVTESATFTPLAPPPPPARYTMEFELSSALETGTVWSVTVSSGASFTGAFVSTGLDLNATGLLSNTYTVTVATVYSPDHLTQYTPVTASQSLPIHANGTKLVAFTTEFWVTINVAGPGAVTPGSGWRLSGSSLALAAVPNFGDTFLGWTGTGSGSYTGPALNDSVTVTAPVTETAEFGLPVHSAPSTTSATSPWTSLSAEAGLAVAGLVVGVVLGLILARGRVRPPADSSAPPANVEETPAPPPDTGTGGAA
jgi:Divergent InlB B-repeat domain